SLLTSIILFTCLHFSIAQEAQPITKNAPVTTQQKHVGGKQSKGKHHEQLHKKRGKHHKPIHKLQLSEDQKKQVKAIQENYKKEMVTLKKTDQLTLGEFKKKTAQLSKERKTKMNSLLTNEQKQKIASHKQKMQENKQVHAAAKLERMRLQLNLDEKQVAALKANQDKGFESMNNIINNENLDKQSKKEALHELKNSQVANLKKVLTQEQLLKLESMKKQHHHPSK
ncbi:MAG: hypothetical protein ACOVNY_02310, partial [Chitinophagaceae bacterium]